MRPALICTMCGRVRPYGCPHARNCLRCALKESFDSFHLHHARVVQVRGVEVRGVLAPGAAVQGKDPLARNRSCTQSWLAARWRTLPIPLREQMPCAAVESAWRRNGMPRATSRATLRKSRPSLAPLTTPASSASPELRVGHLLRAGPVLQQMAAAHGATP